MASSSLQQAKAMPPVLTVSQLVSEIKSSLEHSFRTVDLEAEISNWRPYPSGHCYFSLKDSGAQISAVLFASVPCDCRDRLCDGRRVKVRAQVTLYPQRGDLQLKILRIKVAGEGELMAQYLALKAKLEAEGLFDRSRKRPLPPMPRRIGLVTSPAGAVVHDMCRVLTRRFRNLEIRLFPAQVQGVDAPRSLIAGLAYFNSLFDDPDEAAWRPDLVIVARGGGSFEDLFCFNDEGLVRAIAASRAPVISAVGHETDYTLCDFAADKRAGTPSIAAETAVPELASVCSASPRFRRVFPGRSSPMLKSPRKKRPRSPRACQRPRPSLWNAPKRRFAPCAARSRFFPRFRFSTAATRLQPIPPGA